MELVKVPAPSARNLGAEGRPREGVQRHIQHRLLVGGTQCSQVTKILSLDLVEMHCKYGPMQSLVWFLRNCWQPELRKEVKS